MPVLGWEEERDRKTWGVEEGWLYQAGGVQGVQPNWSMVGAEGIL